jgi:predicted nicotinamide N-methyase
MIDRVEQANGKEIRIAQDLNLSHAGTVWDGAIVMLYYWNKHPDVTEGLFKGKRVLELGAGTGLVGVASSAFNPTKVYLTDLPEYLTILGINTAQNKFLSCHPNCL